MMTHVMNYVLVFGIRWGMEYNGAVLLHGDGTAWHI